MYSLQVVSLLGVLAVIFCLSRADPVGRLYDGQPVDNLRQFPHHVSIVVSESKQKCGGSILNSHWIVTSASCVKYGIRLDLFFRKKDEYDNGANFFSISVNKDQVFVYPTNYDDIALIKVPITLDFSDNLSPINISSLPIEALRGRFTVMPGFSEQVTTTQRPATTTTGGYTTSTVKTTTEKTTTTTCFACTLPPPPAPTTLRPLHDDERRTDRLQYGMFNVLENKVCRHKYSDIFDQYTQLCVASWGDNPNRPSNSDYGSGLIVGWPAQSELVGLYSMFSPGWEENPSVFTFIGKYKGWIESLIRE